MTTIMPQSELTRKAIAWICEEKERGDKTVAALIEEAAMRFNLGPKDVEFMTRFFKQQDID